MFLGWKKGNAWTERRKERGDEKKKGRWTRKEKEEKGAEPTEKRKRKEEGRLKEKRKNAETKKKKKAETERQRLNWEDWDEIYFQHLVSFESPQKNDGEFIYVEFNF